MSANRIESLRQIIARPTTCEGERAAAQRTLDSLLRKQPERSSQAPTESFVEWFVRTQRSGPSRTRVNWTDPPKSERDATNGLPRAELREHGTYRIEVESEARMESLFRGSMLNWHVNRDGEVWIVDYVNGFIRDDSGATKRWFMLVHTSNMRKA